MSVAASPLRDRMVFVQGAPRSGTSWLVMLLATHPEIAGMQAESHLFEFGLDHLFDNFELRDPKRRGLDRFVEREELVNLVRDLCDGVFLSMSAHVTRGAPPRFVVEKTPTAVARGARDLERKRECYPDARYVHILRDGEAVTRSLMRAPFMSDRSEAACRDYWRRCVKTTRETLGDLPHYREITYEQLVEDPAEASADLFGWLGVDTGPAVLETVRCLSREKFSELPVVASPATTREMRKTAAQSARRYAGKVRGKLASVANGGSPAVTGEAPSLAFELLRAMYEQDSAALRAITSGSVRLALRTPEGDLVAGGDDARQALLQIAARLFDHRRASELWASVGGHRDGSSTLAAGKPLWTLFFHGLDADAKRVDLSFALTADDDRVTDVEVITAGSLEGRPVSALDSELGAFLSPATEEQASSRS